MCTFHIIIPLTGVVNKFLFIPHWRIWMMIFINDKMRLLYLSTASLKVYHIYLLQYSRSFRFSICWWKPIAPILAVSTFRLINLQLLYSSDNYYCWIKFNVLIKQFNSTDMWMMKMWSNRFIKKCPKLYSDIKIRETIKTT